MGQQHLKTGAFAMHRASRFRLSKLIPAAREVRLQKDERSTRLNVSLLALYPINDKAHSYEQLTFKDTSGSCERAHADLDGRLLKTNKKKSKRRRRRSWQRENDI